MVIVMEPSATRADTQRVIDRIKEIGLQHRTVKGAEETIVGIIGDTTRVDSGSFEVLSGVGKVMRVTAPYKIASRGFQPWDSVIRVGDIEIGGEGITIIAGPCVVEREDWLLHIAEAVKGAGAVILRGGAFKPRTSPYSFQGLGEAGLKMLVAVRNKTGLPIITEVMSIRQMELAIEYGVDILQIGSRNMQNFELLKAVGQIDTPVMLKRGMAATIDDFLLAAEYILYGGNHNGGNHNVILCERGVKGISGDGHTRNILDLNAIPVLKRLSHLPVFVDPSHGVGRRDLIADMALSAVAAGVDGLMIEVHHKPEETKCDGAQSISPEQFLALVPKSRRVAEARGEKLLS